MVHIHVENDFYTTHCKKCFGCLATFDVDASTAAPHPYIGAGAACWEMYGHILAKEFSDPQYFTMHRVTVDTYCAQHIGDQTDRRSRQSATLHLIALFLTFVKKAPQREVLDFLRKVTASKRDWPAQKQRLDPHWLTVQDIIKADSTETHAAMVMEWGQSVWNAYGDCHDEIARLYENF